MMDFKDLYIFHVIDEDGMIGDNLDGSDIAQTISYIEELQDKVRFLEKELAKRPTRKLTMEERYDLAIAKLVHHHELPTGEDS